MSVADFLAAFFPDSEEAIHFRAFKPKDAPDSEYNRPVKRDYSRGELTSPKGALGLRALNHHMGVYFAPNAGGSTDADITRFNAVFVENDLLTIPEQHEALDRSPLPTSIRVETKRSVHGYWLLKGDCTAERWRKMQSRLIHVFNGDVSIKNPSRVMRLPFFTHLTYNPNAVGKYDAKLVEVVQFDANRRYSMEELEAAFPQGEDGDRQSGKNAAVGEIIGNGHRNATLFSLAGSMRRRGLGQNEIMAALREVNETRVRPRLQETELSEIANGVMRYPAEAPIASNGQPTKEEEEFKSLEIPTLPAAALYGLAGDVIRTLEPHTEADCAALLAQFLAAFGCVVGKSSHFWAEADCHYTKIFTVIVGASSKGRKGTSWGHIKRLFALVDESFLNCVHDGLSSGEGLIFHVRDEQTKKTAIKKQGRIVDYQDEIVDEGAKEKRAFVLEPEFARVLKVMRREGNTLSSVIRQAWDSDRLRVMTKTPLVASNTHISITGHITLFELLRNLDETEMANGFANRFLWVFSRRSKYLPYGGSLKPSDLNPLVQRLHEAVAHTRETYELRRDEGADALWGEVYRELSDGHSGMLGSVTSRSEAQVMRLASLYALLDCSKMIRAEHLEAALAFWKYCFDSAKYIFGNQTGDKTADKIYEALQANPGGLTRTQLRDLFNRNATPGQIGSGLKLLIELGRVDVENQKTEGRPVERYRVRPNDNNDINDQMA